jgi:prepilin-type processing-associated H-X9-DG protein
MKKAPRHGFTIFQLLTVVALLALLFALLLPAIVKVRKSAERVQSQNNLKQMALACHNYHDTFRSLPPGNDENGFSAAARLLPYIEQNNLYQQIDFKKAITDKANAEVRKTQIKLFLSPQDPVQTVDDVNGATNYLFNAGSKFGLADNDGLFYQNSKIRFADVLDGTSNTLMIGETLKGDGGKKAVDVRRQYVYLDDKNALKTLTDDSGVADFKDNKHIAGDRCASWMDGRLLQGTFTGTRMLNDPKPDVSCGGAGGLSGLRSLEEGTNVAMCDGSVRFVKQKTSLEVWKLLTSRNDGQVLPEF